MTRHLKGAVVERHPLLERLTDPMGSILFKDLKIFVPSAIATFLNTSPKTLKSLPGVLT